MILTVDRIFNRSVLVIPFAISLRIRGLGRLSFPGSLTYSDLIGYIFDISYTDIGKQCTLYYYIYNR